MLSDIPLPEHRIRSIFCHRDGRDYAFPDLTEATEDLIKAVAKAVADDLRLVQIRGKVSYRDSITHSQSMHENLQFLHDSTNLYRFVHTPGDTPGQLAAADGILAADPSAVNEVRCWLPDAPERLGLARCDAEYAFALFRESHRLYLIAYSLCRILVLLHSRHRLTMRGMHRPMRCIAALDERVLELPFLRHLAGVRICRADGTVTDTIKASVTVRAFSRHIRHRVFEEAKDGDFVEDHETYTVHCWALSPIDKHGWDDVDYVDVDVMMQSDCLMPNVRTVFDVEPWPISLNIFSMLEVRVIDTPPVQIVDVAPLLIGDNTGGA